MRTTVRAGYDRVSRVTATRARTVGVAERRARLAARHRLATAHQADAAADVARDVVALHATDPSTVHLAVAARLRTPAIEATERALYHERTLVRLLGMRRTMFVVPVDLVPVVHAACTRKIAATERRRLVDQIEQGGAATDGAAWLDRVGDLTVAALEARGEALASELSADVPELRRQIDVGTGTRWATTITLSTRVLSVLAADERIVRGRPRGSWTSTQYRWAPMSSWVPAEEAPLGTVEAQAELARRWLASFGPGTVDDLKWWTGWTKSAARAALAAVGAVEVDLGGLVGYLLADDIEPAPPVDPWVALLPALDPTAMGWTERGWYLGGHRAALFDRSGNIGPSVWWDGRIVGGWAQRPDGEVVSRLLDDVGAQAASAVEAAAARLSVWLGETRVRPRFRTPLERVLTA